MCGTLASLNFVGHYQHTGNVTASVQPVPAVRPKALCPAHMCAAALRGLGVTTKGVKGEQAMGTDASSPLISGLVCRSQHSCTWPADSPSLTCDLTRAAASAAGAAGTWPATTASS
jgi:hypothetical protein